MLVADILVVNYGFHYATIPELYEEHLELLFAQMAAFNRRPGKIALFRETSADHQWYSADSGGNGDGHGHGGGGGDGRDEITAPERVRGISLLGRTD